MNINNVCEWDYNGNDWETGCDCLSDMSPALYCPYCGKKIYITGMDEDNTDDYDKTFNDNIAF